MPKTYRNLLISFLFSFLFFAPFCLSQGSFPDGDYQITFDGEVDIWDVSGTYNTSEAGIGLGFTLVSDGKGKFKGGGSADVNGTIIDFTFTGSLKRKADVVVFKLKMKLKGTLLDTKFSATAKYNLEINEASRTMVGTLTIKVRALGLSDKLTETVTLDIPDGNMDGSWDLNYNIQDIDGKKIITTGMIQLSNGEMYQFDVKGKYNAKKFETKLKFKGIKDTASKGMKISLIGDLDQAVHNPNSMRKFKGKVLGQKFKL